MGRKKEFLHRVTVPITDELLQAIDSVLTADEIRLDVIRVAIQREIDRRRLNLDDMSSVTLHQLDDRMNAVEDAIGNMRSTLNTALKSR
ncbi:hypothetical protein [Brucella anthropi]|uniref:hypothetical protein n=1 Tax=Brucella anthropi TaxID=529 RepID=UPI002157E8BE|nr:hypothetical protein [Brucella anthropi]MCR8493663.1 hypothetical protein [Brucella anthropi]